MLEVSCFKNIGRGNFTSCRPKKVNSKKNFSEKLIPFAPYMQNMGSIRQLGAKIWADSHSKLGFATPLLKDLLQSLFKMYTDNRFPDFFHFLFLRIKGIEEFSNECNKIIASLVNKNRWWWIEHFEEIKFERFPMF